MMMMTMIIITTAAAITIIIIIIIIITIIIIIIQYSRMSTNGHTDKNLELMYKSSYRKDLSYKSWYHTPSSFL